MSRASRGATFERAVMVALRRQGWFVVRAAGSHGPADLLAVEPVRDQTPGVNEIAFVQAKLGGPGRLAPAEWNWLVDLAIGYGGIPLIAHRPKRGVVAFERLIAHKPDHGVRGPAAPCEPWAPWNGNGQG